MPVLNPTRRRAVLYGFIPLMVFYVLYSLKLHHILPSITTWPTEQRFALDLDNLARHKILPWLFEAKHTKGAANVEDKDDEDEYYDDEKRAPFSRHIVAVGDLHGDMPNARKVLTFAGVINELGDWSGDVDFFVQTGDIIDRGDDTIPLFLWMERLRAQAHDADGTVLSHLGNHEWMNAIGDWRYVYPSELKTFGTIAARQRMITTGRIGRAWAQNYTTASRLPLHPSIGPPNTPYPRKQLSVNFQKEESTLEYNFQPSSRDPMSHAALSFVHGGLSPTYDNLSPFPTKINELSHSLLAKLQQRPQPPPHPPHPYPGLPQGTTPEEARLYDANGPLWYRGWATETDEVVCTKVDQVLAKTGTRRMIMGHTPDFHNIKSRCNGKIIIIDTGISHAYGGVLSALSIHYTLHPVGDNESKRWIEKEVVSALYFDRQEIIVTEEREVVGDFEYDYS